MSSGKGYSTQVASSIPFNGTGTVLSGYTNVQDAIVATAQFGGGFNYSEDEAESSTTSSIYVEKLCLSPTLPSTDNYLLSWTCEAKTDNGNSKEIQVRVQIDDTIILDEFTIRDTKSEWDVRSGFRMLELAAGSHNLDVDYRSITSTAYLQKVRLSIWRVEPPT